MWNLQNLKFCHFNFFSKSQHLYFILSFLEIPKQTYVREKSVDNETFHSVFIISNWDFFLRHGAMGSSQDMLSNRNSVALIYLKYCVKRTNMSLSEVQCGSLTFKFCCKLIDTKNFRLGRDLRGLLSLLFSKCVCMCFPKKHFL